MENLAQLKQDLTSDSLDIVFAAIHRASLSNEFADEMLPSLSKLLTHSTPAVRQRALFAMNALCTPNRQSKYIATLSRILLSDPDEIVKIAAADTLATFGEDAIAELTRALESRDPSTRSATAGGVSHLKNGIDKVLPVLINVLDDPSHDVALTAASSLKNFGKAALEPLTAFIARSTAPFARVCAAKVLTAYDPTDPHAIACLLSAIQNDDSEVRTSAASVLIDIPAVSRPMAIEQYGQLLSDRGDFVRQFALLDLIALGPAYTKALLARVTELLADDETRVLAIEAIGGIGPDAAPLTHVLANIVKSDVAEETSAAVRALGKIGPAVVDALPVLHEALEQFRQLDHRDPSVGEIESELLSAIDSIQGTVLAPERRVGSSVPDLVGVLADGDDMQFLDASDELIRQGPDAVEAILEHFKDNEDLRFRVRACTVFREIGPLAMATIPVLVDNLGDSREYKGWKMNEYYGLALQHIGEASIPFLEQVVMDEQKQVVALKVLEKISKPWGAR